VRTTVRIDDDLLSRAKQYAARHRRSLNSVLEDALRELLERHQRQPARTVIDLVVYRGDGVMPGVDLDSSAAVHELLDEEYAARRLAGAE
jgi:hypothetical protein